MLVLLPASSHAKRGPIKHAVDDQAVSLYVKELQLALPGAAALGFEWQRAAITEFFQAFGVDLQVRGGVEWFVWQVFNRLRRRTNHSK